MIGPVVPNERMETMGGSKYANRADTCAGLCNRHHAVLDGRTALGTLRWELNEMMRHVIRQSALLSEWTQ